MTEKNVLLFIPPLVKMLNFHEQQKGSNLTENEVVEITNKAVFMSVPKTIKTQMDIQRGFIDLDPENIWVEWVYFKKEGNFLK